MEDAWKCEANHIRVHNISCPKQKDKNKIEKYVTKKEKKKTSYKTYTHIHTWKETHTHMHRQLKRVKIIQEVLKTISYAGEKRN